MVSKLESKIQVNFDDFIKFESFFNLIKIACFEYAITSESIEKR